ncbi:ADP compounds hydrolase NudE [Idiomarina tyrosinivorans]|nr:ADP compounds hydrolase NudE [Idiomarina tyrosinivorans]
MSKRSIPKIIHREVVAKSRLLRIESLDLQFSNGVERKYERMQGSGRGAVMIVPFIDADTLVLVREYAAGLHSYQLGFPKGLIDPGESPEQAANRELREEIGYGAKRLHTLYDVTSAPQFFNASMRLYVGTDLYPEKLPGDEPEPLELVHWPVDDVEGLLAQPDFNEARSVAALLLMLRQRELFHP